MEWCACGISNSLASQHAWIDSQRTVRNDPSLSLLQGHLTASIALNVLILQLLRFLQQALQFLTVQLSKKFTTLLLHAANSLRLTPITTILALWTEYFIRMLSITKVRRRLVCLINTMDQSVECQSIAPHSSMLSTGSFSQVPLIGQLSYGLQKAKILYELLSVPKIIFTMSAGIRPIPVCLQLSTMTDTWTCSTWLGI
jgi:hypothetical protein